LVSGGQDGARFWHIQTAETVEKPLEGEVRKSLFSSNSQWLAVRHPTRGVTLYEYPKLKIASESRATGFPLRFSPEGNELVTLQQRDGLPAQILRWSIPELRLLSTTEIPSTSVPLTIPELSPSGRWLIAGIAPNQIGFWDLEKNICAGHFPQVDGVGHLRAMAISRSGRYFAASYHDWPVVYITDFLDEDNPLRGVTARHRGQVRSLVFSADERTLISGDSDKFIKIWDVATKEERATLLGHRLALIDLDISPDGRTVVSSSEDGTVRLWNVATRREVARFKGDGVMEHVTFAPDGNALLLTSRVPAGQIPTTTVWRAPPLTETDAPLSAATSN
jgi:WD40 repeat protein